MKPLPADRRQEMYKSALEYFYKMKGDPGHIKTGLCSYFRSNFCECNAFLPTEIMQSFPELVMYYDRTYNKPVSEGYWWPLDNVQARIEALLWALGKVTIELKENKTHEGMSLKDTAAELKRLADEMLEALVLQTEPSEDKPTREEKNLPESWDDLPWKYREESGEEIVRVHPDISTAFDALSLLYDLRRAYWDAAGIKELDWADPHQHKYSISFNEGCLPFPCNAEDGYIIDVSWSQRRFLSFPTLQQAQHFLQHHLELIKKAQPLL